MKFKTITGLLVILLSTMIIVSCAKKEEAPKTDAPELTTQKTEDKDTTATTPTIQVPANVLTVGAVTPSTKKAPIDFTWQDGSGMKKFSDIAKGKVVFVNFWATWCPPCRAEIPDLIEISRDLKDKDFVIIGVASLERDPASAMDTICNFVNRTDIPYNIFVDSQQLLANEYAKVFGETDGIPTTYIFDKKGKLSKIIVGSKTKDEFMSYINKLL